MNSRFRTVASSLVILAVSIALIALVAVVGAADDPPTTPDQPATDPTAPGGLQQPPEVALVHDPDGRVLTNDELHRVRKHALRVTGEGTVIDVDRSDDLGEAYEVEVLTERGEVDVALDRNFEHVPNLRYDD